MSQKRNKQGKYRKSYLGKLLILLVLSVGVYGVTTEDITATTTYVVEVTKLVDPVDIYFANKLSEYKKQLELEEKVLRNTLEFENNHVILKEEYYALGDIYASSTDELTDRFKLLTKMGIMVDYAELAIKEGIKTIE